MVWRVARAAWVCGVAGVALSACGGGSSNSDTPSGDSGSGGSRAGSAGQGAGAAGKAGTANAVPCGAKICKGLHIPQAQGLDVAGCCADPDSSSCGLDSSGLAMFGPTLSAACQPLSQPGKLDAACAESVATPVTGTPLTIQFPGCCRPSGSCGYLIDSIGGGLVKIGLGCVDSAPFLDGGMPASCGAGGSLGGAK